jgi:hypothetical protein
MAQLTCTATGMPPPIITWQRNGIRVETADRYALDGKVGRRIILKWKLLSIVLVIAYCSIEKLRCGYLCVCWNGNGGLKKLTGYVWWLFLQNEAGIAQQAYTLEVLVAPKIQVVSPDDSVIPVGKPFSLKCGARGYPEPTISWSFNGRPVISGVDGYSVGE